MRPAKSSFRNVVMFCFCVAVAVLMALLISGCTLTDASGARYTLQPESNNAAIGTSERMCYQRVYSVCMASITTYVDSEGEEDHVADHCATMIGVADRAGTCRDEPMTGKGL